MSDLKAVFWLVAGLILIPFAVVYAVAKLEPEHAKPVFGTSQMVKTKVGGHIGQVIRIACNSDDCFYDVRFNALQLNTNTRMLGADGPVTIAPVSMVRSMRTFELQAAN